MTRLRIGTDHEGLSLTPDAEFTGAPPDVLQADLNLTGLAVTVRVVQHYATGFIDLADFFDRLARDWRGWDGAREWESLEGDLKIEAKHIYGHVRLRVTVRRFLADWGNDGWSATGDLTIDPGEQMAQIATNARILAEGS